MNNNLVMRILKTHLLVAHHQLNGSVWDSDLPKEGGLSYLGLGTLRKKASSLQEFYFYTHRRKGLISFFEINEDFVYCVDAEGLSGAISCEYDADEWRLFTDSSKASLNCVLLHNVNDFVSMPVGHSVHLKETYDENMQIVLEKLKCNEHK